MVCTFNRQHAHVHSNRFMILSCIAKFINAGRRSTYMEACMCTFHLRCVCISNKPAQLVSKAVQMEETADQQEA